MTVDPDQRRRDLATIHLGAKFLGLDDATYRDMLWAVARVRSARDLNFEGRRAVISHLRGCGFKGEAPSRRKGRRNAEWGWVDQAAPDRQPMLRKIIMCVHGTGRDKAYVDAMAQRMFGVELLKFCQPRQLHGLISALEYDRARRAARAQREREKEARP